MPTSITQHIPGIGGVIKQRPDDFFVDEQALYEPAGSGEHLYLFVEKRGLTTSDAVHRIARAFRVRKSDVGYAGMKDKQAVTRQHFSVHLPGKRDDETQCLAIVESAQMKVLWADRHGNKLRRGHLAGNRFIIRIRQVEPTTVLAARRILDSLTKTGTPNYFGPQRFGHRSENPLIGRLLLQGRYQDLLDTLLGGTGEGDGDQVRAGREAYAKRDFAGALEVWPRFMHAERQALDSLRQGKDAEKAVLAINSVQRDFFCNALQSAAFNAVLDRRIAEGHFDRLIEGDLAWKHDSRSVFPVDGPTCELENGPEGRVAKQEVSASGPMWGQSMLRPTGRVLDMELEALRGHGIAAEEMITSRFATLEGARRPMRVSVTNAGVAAGVDEHGGYVQLSFDLPRGSYATMVLHEVMKTKVDEEHEED